MVLRGRDRSLHRHQTDTVYKWIAEKQMSAHGMGRLWKFRKGEVNEWVASGGADEGGNEDGPNS